MPTVLTKEQLVAFAPRALASDRTASSLALNMQRCEITAHRRVRHFMAHLYVESLGFTRLEENLNYSAQRLCEVWPSRFPTTASALPYARNPRNMARKVYGGRMGNNTLLDGYLYRGGGWIMLTGKTNYTHAGEWTGLDLVKKPELARTPEIASLIACDFWRTKGLNAVVDKDADEIVTKALADQIRINEEDDLEEGTRIVNGGSNGLAARRNALQRAARIWS